MKASATPRVMKFFTLLGYTVFAVLVTATLLELLSWAGWSAYRRIHPELHRNEAASPAFAGDSWAAEFWLEESARVKVRKVYVPFRLWGVTAWHGKYVNNDESEMGIWRRTINPVSRNCEPKQMVKIWMFGGSAMYGTGVPDWATIPSKLSRELNSRGANCVVVINFGVEGYVTNQELIALMEQLKADRHPDIVIFYDGVNDSAVAGPTAGPVRAHHIYETIKARIEGTLAGRFDFLTESYTFHVVRLGLQALHRRRSPGLTPPELELKAAAVLDNYEANLRVLRTLGKAYGFQTLCFWQPSLWYGHKPLVPFEQHEVDAIEARSDPWDPVLIEVYKEAEQRSAKEKDFVFLGGLFDSVKDPVYLDNVHLGPRGNELAAHAIEEYIEDRSER
jgi:lysophospholipase L1-like esterase